MKDYIYLFLIISALVSLFTFAGYKTGKDSVKCHYELNEITNRYFEIIGNPSTKEEQEKFEYIIYGEIR